ncbi:MAG: MoaD/ThiS family protein [Microscillaceae bacterium]|nr:MoaD/ThiS family protein [Microscillaceae bacterium]
MITYQIRLFGIAREIVGQSWLAWETEKPLRAGELQAALQAHYPDLGRLASLLLAVNAEYAQGDEWLQPEDELALIPPVSGG